jgi:hypothetical protein
MLLGIATAKQSDRWSMSGNSVRVFDGNYKCALVLHAVAESRVAKYVERGPDISIRPSPLERGHVPDMHRRPGCHSESAPVHGCAKTLPGSERS